MRTQVGIIGAGPAELMLARLLDQAGIEAVVLESRSRAYVEGRIRAGVLERGTTDLLVEAGVGRRMQRDGIVHHGIELQFDGERDRIPLSELAGGRSIVIYGQTEVVKDLLVAGSRRTHRSCSAWTTSASMSSRASGRGSGSGTTAQATSSNATSSPGATASTASAGRRFQPAHYARSSATTRSAGSGSLPSSHPRTTSSSTRTGSGASRCSVSARSSSHGSMFSAGR